MKRALLFLLISCVPLLWITGCDSSAWNPPTPTSQAQVAFLQAANLPQAAQVASRGLARPSDAKLMVMNADGSEQQALDTAPYTAVHLSNSGSTLVASVWNAELGMRLMVGSINGPGVQDITPAGTMPQMPELSPDGSKVFFLNTAPLCPEIWSVNVNGNTPTNLNPEHDYCMGDVTVAPDNSKLYFVGSSNLNDDRGIFSMSTEGTQVTLVLPKLPETNIYHPAVTSDGTTLVFEEKNVDGSFVDSYKIGGNLVLILTDTGKDEDPLIVGDKILFISDRNAAPQVYSMNLNGTGQTALTNTSVPNWFGDYWFGNIE